MIEDDEFIKVVKNALLVSLGGGKWRLE